MKKLIVLILLLSFIGLEAQSKKKPDMLDKFITQIKNSRDISFNYQVSIMSGTISISKEAVYLSQKNRMEIYETADTRYIFNKKRNKVDIDRISNKSSNISLVLQWIEKINDYEIVSKEKVDNGAVKYKLQGAAPLNEVIEILFTSKGVISELSYQNININRMTAYISEFVADGKPTTSYFTFNPEIRKDIEVTDYRKE